MGLTDDKEDAGLDSLWDQNWGMWRPKVVLKTDITIDLGATYYLTL